MGTAPDELILPSSVILNGTLHKRLDVSASKSLLKNKNRGPKSLKTNSFLGRGTASVVASTMGDHASFAA